MKRRQVRRNDSSLVGVSRRCAATTAAGRWGGLRRGRRAGSGGRLRGCGLSASARRVGAWLTSKASKPTRRMKGIRSDSTLPTARSSAVKPCFSRSRRAVEKARPSLNLGKLSAIRAKRGRSAAMSSIVSPASTSSPSGALRWPSCSRSASQRFFDRIVGPSGSGLSASAFTQVSCQKAPSRQIARAVRARDLVGRGSGRGSATPSLERLSSLVYGHPRKRCLGATHQAAA